jgi:hypothetical protein
VHNHEWILALINVQYMVLQINPNLTHKPLKPLFNHTTSPTGTNLFLFYIKTKNTFIWEYLIPSLKWNVQIHETTSKLTLQCQQLVACLASLKQKIKMVDIVLRVGIAYSF